MSDVGDLIRTRRAIRRFRPGPIPEEHVREAWDELRAAADTIDVRSGS